MAVPKTAALPLGYIPAKTRETCAMRRKHGHAMKINIADLFTDATPFSLHLIRKICTNNKFYIYHKDSD
jgi:hypothetical protein